MILAQVPGLAIPDIPWAAIAPELVLFGVGLVALLLDTAGRQKLQASFAVAGVLVFGAAAVYWQKGSEPGSDVGVLCALVALAGVLQFGLTGLWRDRPRTLGAILVALGFAGGLGVTIWQWATYSGELSAIAGAGEQALVGTRSLLNGMVAVDGVALFSRFSICVAGLLTVPIGFAYMEERQIHRGEYYPLLLFAATGMTLLASSGDLIMVFVAIEILSLALYVMTALAKRDLTAQESALKYFLLGAFSSALLLYGIALVYGITGSTNIAAAGRALTSLSAPPAMAVAAMTLLILGFAFKTSMVPFHFWTPDVYQGAPTPVTAFMAATTKAAAFAVFIRVFVGALGPLQWTWVPVIWVIAALTMLLGAILAVVQSDAKRMLAYSAIAHAGYIAIGLVSVTPEGLFGGGAVGREATSGMLLYILLYGLMSVGSFGVLALFERRSRKAMSIADLRGIGRRHPLPAMMLGLFLLSLAGIPGTAGFTAKLAVFRAGIEAGHTPLVVIGVVSSVISAFYYLRIIAAMFVEEEPVEAELLPTVRVSGPTSAGLAIPAAAMIVFGVLPGALIGLAQQAATFAS